MRCSLSIVAIFPRVVAMPRVASHGPRPTLQHRRGFIHWRQSFRQAICQSIDNDKLNQSKDYQLRPQTDGTFQIGYTRILQHLIDRE